MSDLGVSQINLTTVEVTWENVARNVHCTDQFRVKYWPGSSNSPTDELLTELLPNNVFHAIITVVPLGNQNIQKIRSRCLRKI